MEDFPKEYSDRQIKGNNHRQKRYKISSFVSVYTSPSSLGKFKLSA